ncbi:Uncharacterised protein [uncultured Butyricicoccus sp.]|uniref:PqqD family protein n=1 Tax=Agathobaculum ammoniilyticum TaxID=2981778 RepID=A0ABT2U1U2_9FIRM|nr:hypothetical protein [Agathobaculum ammoniilyticum]MBS6884155.1 hypothetical protein [Clostridiaceae bacterium]MCU6788573.1 hypothetical protein [Agathobaculum ammoniilyticum]SCI81792.1 Uncharacterised protein [uncultured Butyricicoccus sp.]
MIRVEVNDGTVALEIYGQGVNMLTEVLSILARIYEAYESTEKGAGDELLDIIGRAIQQGKIQEWSEEAFGE